MITKKLIVVALIFTMVTTSLTGCGNVGGSYDLYVYNWGEYIDPEVLELFEEETGYSVSYDEFETNEAMYPKVANNAVSYDVICPSDYMIERLIKEDLLAEINYDNIPNIKYIGSEYIEKSRFFDAENKYSVPYCWGTVGILYNTTMVDEKIDSWATIFDEKYKDNILMIDSVRDAMGIAEKYLGYSLNTTNEKEIDEAKELLIKQKPLVQAYVVDQVRDKMIGGEAAIGVIYSGEAIYTKEENEDLEYVVPKEGSNVWIDSWVIPKSAKNKEAAEAFINFLCRPDIALMNFDYIGYSTPNTKAWEMIEDEELKYNEVAFPGPEVTGRCEAFKYLGLDMDNVYYSKWKDIKME